MGQVAVTLNGRTYTLRCADGEEARLIELAAYVTQRAESLAGEFGPMGDDRLLFMTALLLADELWQARAGGLRLSALNGAHAAPAPPPGSET